LPLPHVNRSPRATLQPTAARNEFHQPDRLIKENPDFKSPDGHLLYARALEADGDLEKARNEFSALAAYFPGAEAKYRYAAILKKSGDSEKANAVLTRLLEDAELSTRHYRKTQKEWLTLARRDLENW